MIGRTRSINHNRAPVVYAHSVFAAERRQRITDIVRASGAASIRDLATSLGVSEVTIRRDLEQLRSAGVIDRQHGGAVDAGGYTHEPTYAEKTSVAEREKAAIADLAAQFVHPGDAVAIGAGTTTQALAQRLVNVSNLTVVTNSLLVAQSLTRARGVEVIMTGGTLRAATHALVGTVTEQALAGLHMSRVFLSGNGLTPERGLSTPSPVVAGVDRAMASAAREVVVLCDHTKIGMDVMVQTLAPARMRHLVTDDGADPATLERFRSLGVEVHVAATRTPAG